ncbi:hypothetical protein AVEN_259585-1 [Araneus ventricosus]|uniref:Uncharacterized protein n=1 Tax=Araneus ventricosus TaxID=182803 RepID=A0A4Y2ES43_ARAVE|nr:hypothetical protein AVEN_259585-1 [Araneus ventricosus]
MYETGITTVQTPDCIIACEVFKFYARIISYETDRPNPEPESTVENEVGPTIIPKNDRPEAGCSKDSVSTFSVLSPADTGAPMIAAEDVGPLTPEDVDH